MNLKYYSHAFFQKSEIIGNEVNFMDKLKCFDTWNAVQYLENSKHINYFKVSPLFTPVCA